MDGAAEGALEGDGGVGGGVSGAPGFDERAWWTLGEAAERGNVTHRVLEDWLADGSLPVREAWREGASIRVVQAGDLARLVPEVRAWRPEVPPSSLDERSLRVGAPRSELGAGGGATEEVTGDHTVHPPADERPYETELRREVERLRREVRELRATRDELGAELKRSELLRERDRRREDPGALGLAPVQAGGDERALTAWSAVVAGIALGLAGAVMWSQTDGGIVEAAPRVLASGAAAGEVERAETPPVFEASRDLPLPFDVSFEGDVDRRVTEPAGAETAEGLLSTGSGEPMVQDGAATEPGADDPPADALTGEAPLAPGIDAEAPAPGPFPVTLAKVDPTAFVAGREDDSSCAFAVLWKDGDPRYRWAIGPCIGGHNGAGVARGGHRVDGAACCAHHAFVERMTSASRDVGALQGLLEEADAARADGLVSPLLRLRAERSAKRFLEYALEQDLGRGAWFAAGLDDGTGEHRWEPDSTGDPMRIALVSWVRLEEGGEERAYRLDLEIDDGPEGDRALSFAWMDR